MASWNERDFDTHGLMEHNRRVLISMAARSSTGDVSERLTMAIQDEVNKRIILEKLGPRIDLTSLYAISNFAQGMTENPQRAAALAREVIRATT